MKIRKENFGFVAQVSRDLRVEYYKLHGGRLSAPLSVSIEITSSCPLSCDYCYSRPKEREMSAERIISILKEIEDAGVFEIHIGGGEPLLREDLFDILSECKRRFITSVTTSGYNLKLKEAIKLAKFTDQVNLNFHSPFFETAFKNLISAELKPAVNLIIERRNLEHLRSYLDRLKRLNVRNVYLLGPKPVKKNLSWYKGNKMSASDLITVKNIIREFIDDLRIFVDCSLIELMSHLPSETKEFFGLFGCQAGIRRLFISSDGKVYPCSFLTEEGDVMGDLFFDNFKDICSRNPFSRHFNKIYNPPICVGRYEDIEDKSFLISGRVSVKPGMSSEHSAADYFFHSIERIPPEKMEKIKRLLENHLKEEDEYGEGEKVTVHEHGVAHYSWILMDFDFIRMLMDEYFDIEVSYYEYSMVTHAKISFPWDEELYTILTSYEGSGRDGSILVRRGKNRIILEFRFYSARRGAELGKGILLPVREGILHKRDFSPLQAFVDFYEIRCPNSGRKEEYSKIARRFRRIFCKGEEGNIPVYFFDKVVVLMSDHPFEKNDCRAYLVFDRDESLEENLRKFKSRNVFVYVEKDYVKVSIHFKIKPDVKEDEDSLEELFKKIREEILMGDFSSLEYIFRFYNGLPLEGIKMTETTEVIRDILDM